MARNISFNGNSLQNFDGQYGIVTKDIDDQSFPAINAKVYAVAHANYSRIPNINYPNRIIKAAGYIQGSSITDLDNRLDSFRYSLLGIDQNLDLDYAGSTRRYFATVTTNTITRPNGLMYANFDIEFTCTMPFGQNTGATTALNATGRTSALYTDTVTINGTAPWQKPVITITLTAVSSTGTQIMAFGNNSNGQQILISRSTWAANDQVVIDTYNKTVKVNGIATDYSGAFPEFPPGSQTFGYNDSFTSRTFNINVVYNQLYI